MCPGGSGEGHTRPLCPHKALSTDHWASPPYIYGPVQKLLLST